MEIPLRQIDHWPVSHAAAALLGPNGIVSQHGDTHRQFRLASISKVMMGYATLIAVEEGSVRLDDATDAVREGVPDGAQPGIQQGIQRIQYGEPAEPNRSIPVTLRHLLSHASGFGFDSGSKQVAPAETKRIYSNEGIERAARHVEQSTEMPFSDYLREAVFEPLGMPNSELRGSPASHVYSNLEDLAVFAMELLHPSLLAPETFAEFTTCQFPTLPGVLPGVGRFDPLPWGLGVELKGQKQPHWSGQLTSPSTFGHFGGSGTFLWVDPTRAIAAVALTDRDFDEWAMAVWPQFNDDIISAYGTHLTG
jgi:CubicO group peptidase (beta-lactamase class C family)